MPRKKKSERVEIEAFKHTDMRTNIPSDETSNFMTDEQRADQEHTYLRYRRDPALDPQLVWQGKDADDADDLRVLVRPIYITERIQPQEIIENVRARSAEGTYSQPYLFGDFNGLEFEEQVDFYNHQQHWSNRMILGDSLAVMAGLAEREALRGQVQMIYIDPPYGIKFNSNWQPSTVKRDVKDGKDMTYEPEQIQAFRDTWKDGVHSYLSYLRDRLRVARELLTDSGSIFVQIGDENVHLVRSLLDEVFGSENFCSQIIFRKTTGKASATLDNTFDILLWYAKNKTNIKYRRIFTERLVNEDENLRFVETGDGFRRPLTTDEWLHPQSIPNGGRVFRPNPLTSQSGSTTTNHWC